jgi:hypothetical protein
MFKRREHASSAGRSWAKTLSAIAAGIGGIVGGLLFWRKRRTS